MADHFSGPRALADPASDIADVFAFPSPERPGHLVLVLDVFPAAAPTAQFSDAVTYRPRLRPLTVTTVGSRPALLPSTDEWTFAFRFGAQSPGHDGDPSQPGTCTLPGGAEITFRTGEEQRAEAPGVQIFAGARLDPFVIDLGAVLATELRGSPRSTTCSTTVSGSRTTRSSPTPRTTRWCTRSSACSTAASPTPRRRRTSPPPRRTRLRPSPPSRSAGTRSTADPASRRQGPNLTAGG
jgi:hypothetical protein